MAEDREPEILYDGVDIAEALDAPAQISVAVRLQTALLRTYEKRLKKGTLSDTGLAALTRLLQQNGWALDPKHIPQGLKDKMTTTMDPRDFDEDDGVVGKIGQG